MSQFNIDEIEKRTLAGLKDFQRATVERVDYLFRHNQNQMLMERHLNKKARRSSHKNHIKGPKKRTEEDDERFTQSFERLIQKALDNC